MSEQQEDMDRIQSACSQLAEHFDAVQIFASRHNGTEGESAGTVSVNWGSGNWNARVGQIKAWIVTKDEETRIDARTQ